MVPDKGEIIYPPPPVQGGVEGHKRKSAHELNAAHGGSLRGSHRPPTHWAPGFHRLDKTGELLPWTSCPTRSPPPVSSPGWGTAT